MGTHVTTDYHQLVFLWPFVWFQRLINELMYRAVSHASMTTQPIETERRKYVGHHWFRWWLVAWTTPGHYLNQCWSIVNCTLRNKLQWNLKIQENAFENVVCEMASILFRPQCAKPQFMVDAEWHYRSQLSLMTFQTINNSNVCSIVWIRTKTLPRHCITGPL